MPDVSSYIKINNKKEKECIVEVNEVKPESICCKGLILYGMFAWFAAAAFLFYMNIVVSPESDHQDLKKVWEHYKAAHGKNYSQEEDEMRICIFLENKKAVDLHNLRFAVGLEPYQKELNKFSDFTPDELDGIRGFSGDIELLPVVEAFTSREGVSYPESFDWRQRGAVSGVKNQGVSCGSCYAFSATGSLEGQWFLKTGRMVSLSEQNLVDCSKPQHNQGCNGGTMNNAFRYILENQGIDTEQSYPYEEREGPCRFRRSGIGATIQGYRSVLPSEAALLAAVVGIGPISVGIHVTNNFFAYQRGIFEDASCDSFSLNHAVLVVGYGSEGGRDFWLVKNSWGSGWGEGGYIRMARNKGNMCGIVSMASYPIV